MSEMNRCKVCGKPIEAGLEVCEECAKALEYEADWEEEVGYEQFLAEQAATEDEDHELYDRDPS